MTFLIFLFVGLICVGVMELAWLCTPPRRLGQSNNRKSCCLVTQLCLTFATPWALLSMVFSNQEYWSVLLFPSPEDLPDLEIKSTSPVLASGFFIKSYMRIPEQKERTTQVCKCFQSLCMYHIYSQVIGQILFIDKVITKESNKYTQATHRRSCEVTL